MGVDISLVYTALPLFALLFFYQKYIEIKELLKKQGIALHNESDRIWDLRQRVDNIELHIMPKQQKIDDKIKKCFKSKGGWGKE